MSTILELRDVRKTYGDFVAVKELDLSVPKSSIYGVLGPNGAGKSTTIRMIMQILLPDTGEILFKGQPVSRETLHYIAYLPEERGLYKKMKVLDHLVYLGRLKGMNTADARSSSQQWLTRFEIDEWSDSKVEDLSKGMQQKIQFLGAIMMKPELIILDEPFSGLDPLNVRLLTGVIKELQEEGSSILFSTHVLEQAEKICDHIFLMNRGEKILDGEFSKIQADRPVDTVLFRGDHSSDDLQAMELVSKVEKEETQLRITLREGVSPRELLSKLSASGAVDHFSAQRPSLHEIFIREVEASGGSLEHVEASA